MEGLTKDDNAGNALSIVEEKDATDKEREINEIFHRRFVWT